MGIVLSASIILDGHKEQKDEDKVYEPPFYIACKQDTISICYQTGWGILICFCIFNCFHLFCGFFYPMVHFHPSPNFSGHLLLFPIVLGHFYLRQFISPIFICFHFFTPSLWHLKSESSVCSQCIRLPAAFRCMWLTTVASTAIKSISVICHSFVFVFAFVFVFVFAALLK